MEIGLSVRAVREPEKIVKKKIKKGHQRYILHMRGGETLEGAKLSLGTFVDPPDVMNRANFHVDPMYGF